MSIQDSMETKREEVIVMEGQDRLTIPVSEHNMLSDHKVNGVAIVPGAYFVARLLDTASGLTDVNFLQMDFPSATDTVELQIHSDANDVKRLVRAGTGEQILEFRQDDLAEPVATLDVNNKSATTKISHLTGPELYSKLDTRGNNYGVRYQGLTKLFLEEGRVIAKWNSPAAVTGSIHRLTSLFDSFTHAIAAVIDIEATYYLNSISRIDLFCADVPASNVSIEVRVTEAAADYACATVLATDEAGNNLIYAENIRINYGQVESSVDLAVASTFTIDPIKDYMDVWSRKMDLKINLHHADYGQLFQSLLQPVGSVFDGRASSQSCFIRFQDWAQAGQNEDEWIAPVGESLHPGLETYSLPDRRLVASLNEYETSYLYKEIFVDQAYKRHNVAIADNDVVIDVGANIGLFSMFASGEAKNVTVVAVEPSPSVLPLLRSNVNTYTNNTTVVAAGAAECRGEAQFTAYKKSSVFSSFMANADDDRSAIRTIIQNMLTSVSELSGTALDEATDEMLKERLDSDQYTCPLISVSDIIIDQKLETVSLLKIDAEKSEEQILKGIKAEHWSRIEQVIIEVHKQSGIGVAGVVSLLTDHGFECVEDEEQFLLDSGLVTVYALKPARKQKNIAIQPITKIQQAVTQFEIALEAYASNNRAMNVVICPSRFMDPVLAEEVEKLEKQLVEKCESHSGISATLWSNWCEKYPVEEVHDYVSDKAGHIPYTEQWYAASATAFLRRHLATVRKVRKVIVLDCDNTIWSGTVGEDGVGNLCFERHNLELQRFAKRMSERGYLICLASKNDEAIVREVFSQRQAEMELRWDSIVSHRVNWMSKAENLVSISDELSLALNSFVFIDDSLAECEQIRNFCPDVLSLQFDSKLDIEGYLEHVWDFDVVSVTKEDRRRSKLYMDESRRQKERVNFASLEDFVSNLQLDIVFNNIVDENVSRASQLSHRTNQFNLSGRRYTESNVRDNLSDSNSYMESVSVTDRFGDYGVTGLLCYRKVDSVLHIDTFLLSCRVIGRSVEHEVAAHLGQRAIELGCDCVVLEFVGSERNQPARLFLDNLSKQQKLLDGNDPQTIEIGASELAKLDYSNSVGKLSTQTNSEKPVAKRIDSKATYQLSHSTVHAIATSLQSAADIVRASESKTMVQRPELDEPYVEPVGDIQHRIASIWQEMLGIEKVGVNDNFFELGGTSLKGVQMVSKLGSLELNVGIGQFYAQPTISGLCPTTESHNQSDQDLLGATEKGRGRRKTGRGKGRRRIEIVE